jgi:hypothetical protein
MHRIDTHYEEMGAAEAFRLTPTCPTGIRGLPGVRRRIRMSSRHPDCRRALHARISSRLRQDGVACVWGAQIPMECRRDVALHVEMLALEYDWAEAAEKALADGFPKWAEALLTGAVG